MTTQDLQSTELDRLRELLERATPGPWAWAPQSGEHVGHGANLFGIGGQQVIAHDSYENMWFAAHNIEQDDANAALILAAVNALPALLDERDELLSSLSAANAVVEEARRVIEPFAILADTFVLNPVVEVCEPHFSNPSPHIAPFDTRHFRAAAAFLARHNQENRTPEQGLARDER